MELDWITKDAPMMKTDHVKSAKIINEKIERLCRVFYSKEANEEEHLKPLRRELFSKFGSLSAVDIQFAFERIIDNKFDVNKYFNVAEILRCVKNYEGIKKRVRAKYFELLNEGKRSEEDTKNYTAFVNQSIMMWRNNEALCPYRKSAIGRHFVDNVENAHLIKELSDKDFPKVYADLKRLQDKREEMAQHEANRKIKAGEFARISEVQIYQEGEPMYWTEDLLFHNYVFERLKK